MCIVLLINNAVNFEMCPVCTITNVPVIHALFCMSIQGSLEFQPCRDKRALWV